MRSAARTSSGKRSKVSRRRAPARSSSCPSRRCSPEPMRILDWQTLDDRGRSSALARPTQDTRAAVTATVAEIVAQVRREGDAALRQYSARFDGVSPERFAVSRQEFAAAHSTVSGKHTAALERAIANVEAFHAAQLPQPLAL